MSKPNLNSRLTDLRADTDVDPTLRNLLHSLTLNLDLRARYRVFEFEARQEGSEESAHLFRALMETEAGQIAVLRRVLGDNAPAPRSIA
jgi:rubrerythrin